MKFVKKLLLNLAIFSVSCFSTVSPSAPEASAAPSFLAGYEVPRDCIFAVSKLIWQTISIVQPDTHEELGCVEIKWDRNEAGRIVAEIEALKVGPMYRGKKFGKLLFNIAVYRLVKDLGAREVVWDAQPLDSTIALYDLVGLYLHLGGVYLREENSIAEMKLSDEKMAEIAGMESEPIVVAPYILKTKITTDYHMELCSPEHRITHSKIWFTRDSSDGVDGPWDTSLELSFTALGAEQLEILKKYVNFDAV
jgi:GNAT superfamily N-acetyltransferase